MNYFETITLDDFAATLSKEIARYSSAIPLKVNDLLPGPIFDRLADTEVKTARTTIPWWESWEYGNREISDDTFLKVVVPAETNSHEEVVLLYDDCFKSGKVYSMQVGQIQNFLNHANEPKSLLFQPSDHLLYFPQRSYLCVLHHDGVKLEYWF